MRLTYKGNVLLNTKIQDFITLLENSKENQLWSHMGLQVEIDPTVNYSNENILIRWHDIEEGFNDKIILNSVNEFKIIFEPINE